MHLIKILFVFLIFISFNVNANEAKNWLKKEIDIIILDEIDSTNNEAQRIIDHKSNFPLWIIANEQTSGRGRKNRYWVSQKGNFMGTFILEHEIEKQYIPHLSFVTSLALKKTIESFNSGIKDIFLKWPNDIIINDSKCAGILIESLRSNNDKEYLAIGIGVNLIKYPLDSSFKATSLKEEFNFDVDRDEFLNKLNINLLKNIKRWEKGKNFSQILEDWKKFAYKINESISMLLPTGKKIEGIFSDLNDQGGLILSHNGEKSVFYAAEIIEELKIV